MRYEPATSADLDALVDLLVEAYHADRAWVAEGLTRRGIDTFRLARSGPQIQAALELIAAGQWFGGRCVPSGTVAWVTTRVAARGTGAARELMQAALAEIRTRGIALSTLFASTASLYRKLGYEWAGQTVRYELPLAEINVRRTDGQVERMEPVDSAEVQAVYTECARRDSGLLARDASFWSDRFDPMPSPDLAAYLVRYEGRPEGYVLVDEKPHDRRLVLRDVMFTTRRAGERLLTLLASYGTLFDAVHYWSGPDDPLQQLLPEERTIVVQQKRWMLRIADLSAALEARGYAPQLQADLHLEVTDPLVPENSGPWQLTVRGGRGVVRRGGEGRLRLDIGVLAALYTGYGRPELLSLADRMAGPAHDLTLAGLVFAGPRPYMADVF